MNKTALLFSLICGSAIVGAAEITVDRFGQSAIHDWPEKVTSQDELQADMARENRELPSAAIDPARFDRFGGEKALGSFRATGFFRTEKIDGRWWLISPEGHPFFLKGIDAAHFGGTGYFSPVKNPDGSARKVFSALPGVEKFPAAYDKTGEKVNFLAANLTLKYGDRLMECYENITERRIRAWNFNACGKWSDPRTGIGRLPYIADHGIAGGRSMKRARDPFDPDFPRLAEQQLAPVLKQRAADPWLIGWQFENENDWQNETLTLICRDVSGDLPAKRALLEMLATESAGKPGSFFGRPGADAESLMREALTPSAIPPPLQDKFVLSASREYHRILRDLLRKYDRNHLVMLNSHNASGISPWLEGAVEFVDVYPIHDYDLSSGWLKNVMLPILRKLDRPFALVEYSFVTTGRGFSFYRPLAVVGTQRERGEAYRKVTAALAADPLCVGFSWFTLYDQPVTMRSLPGGECHNFGLIDVCDRPYREMIPFVQKANAELSAIHAGTLRPETGTVLSLGEALTADFLPESVGNHSFLYDVPEKFAGVPVRLRCNGNDQKIPVPIGVIDLKRRPELPAFRIFVWKGIAPTALPGHFLLEESADAVNYTGVTCVFRPGTGSDFIEYSMSPEKLLPSSRFLRFSMIPVSARQTWATQFAGVE